MRCRASGQLLPRDFFHQAGSRSARHARNEDDLSSLAFHQTALLLIDGFEGVVSAFHINIRLRDVQKMERGDFGENADGINRLQRGKDQGAVRFRVKRPAGAFQCAHGSVAGEANQEDIAEIPRGFQISHVPGVEQIKAAVGDGQGFSARPHGFPPRGQRFE